MVGWVERGPAKSLQLSEKPSFIHGYLMAQTTSETQRALIKLGFTGFLGVYDITRIEGHLEPSQLSSHFVQPNLHTEKS